VLLTAYGRNSAGCYISTSIAVSGWLDREAAAPTRVPPNRSVGKTTDFQVGVVLRGSAFIRGVTGSLVGSVALVPYSARYAATASVDTSGAVSRATEGDGRTSSCGPHSMGQARLLSA
jgi:hypothetical protein